MPDGYPRHGEQMQVGLQGTQADQTFGESFSLCWSSDSEEPFKAKNDGHEEVHLLIKPRRDLEGNFIDVLRGKDQLACNADLGCSTMVAIKMAVESFRQSKTLLWDAREKRVTTT